MTYSCPLRRIQVLCLSGRGEGAVGGAPRETFVDGAWLPIKYPDFAAGRIGLLALRATFCRTVEFSQLRQVGRRRARRLPESWKRLRKNRVPLTLVNARRSRSFAGACTRRSYGPVR